MDEGVRTTVVDAHGCLRMRASGVELCLDLADGYPVVLHWGSPLGACSTDELRLLADASRPHCDLNEPVEPGMLREPARGFRGRPALRGHRSGRDFSPLFAVQAYEVAGDSATIRLTDESAGLALSMTFTMTPQGVLLLGSELSNTGEGVYSLDGLAMWLPVPDRATELLDFSGRWLLERQPNRLPFAPGLRVREGREGRTGHDASIVQCALTPTTTTETGEVWALAPLWSGGTAHLAERDTAGRGALGAGELLEPGEVELAPGERYRAPTIAALYASDGLDGMGARSHAWLRARPGHRGGDRPVTLNVWEAVYFDHSLDTLTRLAERAAAVGVERFVLDDGWFGSRRDDTSGLGDWVVSEDAWPDGLGPLVDAVRSHGMQFGLWFEGEMINEDSELFRAHPDWVLHVPGRMPPLARNQWVLDLTHPDAFAHILERVHAIVDEYAVDYIKWDHNRFLTDPAHDGHPAVRAQTHAIFALFDELRRRSPRLQIESCASGGGRIDLGMAFHADRFWTSDQNDALERQGIQRWTGLVIPPEMLGTHIGPSPSHGTGRVHSLQLRAITALFGHAGIEWNLLEASDEEVEALTAWTAFYRRYRGVLHTGRVVRVEHPDPAALVHGVVALDRGLAIFAYVQLATSGGTRPAAFRLPGLDPEARYRVRAQDFGGASTVQARGPRWYDEGVVVTGAALATVGLLPPNLWPEQAILVMVERIDD